MSSPKTIMIVEDEMMIALHMEDTFSQLGHRVVTATKVREAERLLDAGGVDLAIVDYQLTDGSTESLMQRLHDAGVPFVVCSGMAQDKAISRPPEGRASAAKALYFRWSARGSVGHNVYQGQSR